MLHSRLETAHKVGEKHRVVFFRLNQKENMVSNEELDLETRMQDIEDRFASHIDCLEDKIKNLSCELDLARFKCE